jgi:hypothetical protein
VAAENSLTQGDGAVLEADQTTFHSRSELEREPFTPNCDRLWLRDFECIGDAGTAQAKSKSPWLGLPVLLLSELEVGVKLDCHGSDHLRSGQREAVHQIVDAGIVTGVDAEDVEPCSFAAEGDVLTGPVRLPRAGPALHGVSPCLDPAQAVRMGVALERAGPRPGFQDWGDQRLECVVQGHTVACIGSHAVSQREPAIGRHAEIPRDFELLFVTGTSECRELILYARRTFLAGR